MTIRRMTDSVGKTPEATERDARRIGWTQDMPVTWREFVEQYPYQAFEMIESRRGFGTAA